MRAPAMRTRSTGLPGASSVTLNVALSLPPDCGVNVTATEHDPPTATARPGGIAAGPNDSMWFTEDNGGIGEVSASGSITQFPLPSPLGSSVHD